MNNSPLVIHRVNRHVMILHWLHVHHLPAHLDVIVNLDSSAQTARRDPPAYRVRHAPCTTCRGDVSMNDDSTIVVDQRVQLVVTTGIHRDVMKAVYLDAFVEYHMCSKMVTIHFIHAAFFHRNVRLLL